jgi:lambda family phage portal protein
MRDRLNADISFSSGSADAEALPELGKLRENSRAVIRNNGYAKAIVGTLRDNVVGIGIRPQPRINYKKLGITKEKAKEIQDLILDGWRRWVRYADATNRNNFYSLQALGFTSFLGDGEWFGLPLMLDTEKEPWRDYSFAWQLVEADRVRTPYSHSLRRGRDIREGVERGARGQPIAYWIQKGHPGDGQFTNLSRQERRVTRYRARNKRGKLNVLHFYEQDRIDLTRGVPYLTPILDAFEQLAGYTDAEVVRARTVASVVGAVISADPYGKRASGTTANARGQRVLKFEPGMMPFLSKGEEIKFSPNNSASTAYDPFITAFLVQVCSALRLPYVLVAKDFKKTNYSAARAALIEARRMFEYYQLMLVWYFCQESYERVVEEMWMRGELPIDLEADMHAWCRCKWLTPGWGWVEPLKEAQADEVLLRNKFTTRADVLAKSGKDWEEVLDQLEEEEDELEERGMMPTMEEEQQPGQDGKDGKEDKDEDKDDED